MVDADMATFTEQDLERFRQYMIGEEREAATIEKYVRDIRKFLAAAAPGNEISKFQVLTYKKELSQTYKATSANSMLVALNQFFAFQGRDDLRVKLFKIQKASFRDFHKELSVKEYKKLVWAAKENKNSRLSLLIQTLCSTGIRVSEHRYITVESLNEGRIEIQNKGKNRIVFLPKDLQKRLRAYCREKQITAGAVFVTRSGRPLNRCNIWAEMKALCKTTDIDPQKVFPHNLRHLFALTYYRIEKDLVRLADLLGHSSMETTRIYTSTSAEECARSLARLHLLI